MSKSIKQETRVISLGSAKITAPAKAVSASLQKSLQKAFATGAEVSEIKVGKDWLNLDAIIEQESSRRSIVPAEASLPSAAARVSKFLKKATKAEDIKQIPVAINPAMDPRLQFATANRRMGLRTRSISSAAADEVAVVAKVTSTEEWEQISEVRVGAILGEPVDGTSIVTARIPANRIEAVRANPCVVSLKASQPVRKSLAATTGETGCNPKAYPKNTAPDGGAGVVVGIVDFGGDFVHENFRNADGTTRLLCIWDQSGTAVAGSPLQYGRLYSKQDINAALKTSNPYKKLGYAPDPRDPAHGTHVMDIAAGNGRGTKTPGCAPKADLIFVEASSNDIVWSGPGTVEQSFGDSVQLLEAVSFIFDQAGNRPCVVNLSLGTNGGPHDGSTLVEQGIDRLIRAKPNRAVVIAASNSYSDGIHAAGTVPPAGSFDLIWETTAPQYEREIEIWYPGTARLAVELIAPNGTSLGVVEPGQNLSLGESGNLAIYIASRLDDPNNHDNVIGIFVTNNVDGGRWTVRLHSRSTQPAAFHAWIEREDNGQSHFTGKLNNSYTIGSISCGQESISVGSFDAHKSTFPLSYFSSEGPTRDGRNKPEISAPGHGVIAALSHSRVGTTPMSGTSMAAPAVTGLVALLLAEAHRQKLALTSAQIRSSLIQSARKAPPAGTSWHPRYGNGRAHIGALSALPKGPNAAAAKPKQAAAKNTKVKSAKKAKPKKK